MSTSLPLRVLPLALALASSACNLQIAPRDAPLDGNVPTTPDGGVAADASVESDASSGAAPTTPWAHAYLGDVQIDGMASDAQAVYAAGYFVGRASFGPGHVLESVVGADGAPTKDIYVSKHARAGGALGWVRHFGGAGAEGNVYDLVAGSDLVLASGAFSGTVDFDGKVLRSTIAAGQGSASSGTYGNMFLAALGADGNTRWALQATGDVLSGGNEVATAPSGGFVQVGMMGGRDAAGGKLIVGPHELPFTGGFFDTYVAKVSKDGDVAWAVPVGGSGAQRGKAIATDSDGNVLVAGDAWSGETRFGPGATFTSDDQDFWVAKYSPAGALLFWKSYRSTGVDEVKGIGADASGNIVVAAAFQGPSLDLGGTKVTAAAGAKNTGIVFALSADGARVLWNNTITSVSKCCELEVDARGHTLVANAALAPSVRYGDGSEAPVGGAPLGGLLTELDRSGARVGSWTVQADRSELGELTLLGDGAVALAGAFEGAELRAGDLRLAGGGQRTQFVLVVGR